MNTIHQLLCICRNQSNSLSDLNFQRFHNDENVFNLIENLDCINLYSNLLNSIPENLFKNNNNLTGINLQNNQLKDISENHFKNLSKLHTLCLTNNQIENIHENAFDSFQNLRFLLLDSNHLSSVKENTFSNLFALNKELAQVSLENNPLDAENKEMLVNLAKNSSITLII